MDFFFLRALKVAFFQRTHRGSAPKAFSGSSVCLSVSLSVSLFVLLLPVVTHEPCDAEQLPGDKSGRNVYYAAVAT